MGRGLALRIGTAALVSAVALLALASIRGPDAGSGEGSPQLFGFTRAHSERQRRVEARFLGLPSPARAEAAHRHFTAEPHVAGSPRDRALAEWVRDRWREYGLDDVSIVEHEVLLPYPRTVSVEMTAPRPWRASMKEDPVPGDPDTARTDLGIPYHAYSASGDVTAPVVYAGSGNPAEYDWLAARGIDVRGKLVLVRYSVPYSYRGFKALTAQQRGAAGVLIYSDPADDGFAKGATYPDGPWGPDSHIQRGGIVYDFLVPGDPLTPGWASTPGARRIRASDAMSIPRIMSAPLSYRDARAILESLGGPDAPPEWRGALPIKYRVGPGPATVRLRLDLDDGVRPIWTVIGRIRGTALPRQTVIAGNHRDAWVFGGVDPATGSASLMEVARGLGALAKRGMRPRRSIVLASWDAEEFTLTSSTEWGEQHADDLRAHAVAYLNVDSAASGARFSAAAVPSLNRVIDEALARVADPATGRPLAETPDVAPAQASALPTGGGRRRINNRLGSGSDYTVFLNHLGVPIVDLTFDGPYGVYHSIYDSHEWVRRFGDPGFRYQAAMAQVWGVLALRLANADALPIEPRAYANAIDSFVTEARGRARWVPSAPWSALAAALGRLRDAAARLEEERGRVLAQPRAYPGVEALNDTLLMFERTLLDPGGIPGRPWYQHQIYAPKFTYAPQVLPGIAQAIDDKDAAALAREIGKLAQTIDRAAAVLAR